MCTIYTLGVVVQWALLYRTTILNNVLTLLYSTSGEQPLMRFLTTHSWVECCFSGFLMTGAKEVGRDYRWSTCVYTKNVGHVVYIRHCKGKVADSWFSSHSWPYLVVWGQDMYARVGDPPHLIHSATWMLCTVYIITSSLWLWPLHFSTYLYNTDVFYFIKTLSCDYCRCLILVSWVATTILLVF